MIVGLGVDISEVDRIREAMERHGQRFLERVFTAAEIAYCTGTATAPNASRADLPPKKRP